MDQDRFDSLARVLAGAVTRRSALAIAAAALLPSAGEAESRRARRATAPADRRGNQGRDGATGEIPSRDGDGRGPSVGICLAAGQRCGKGSGRNGKPCRTCCSKHAVGQANGKRRCACKAAGMPATNAAQCCAGRRSAGGFCGACDPGLTTCPTGCVDVQADAANCGACGNACGAGRRCVNGSCACDDQGCAAGCCDGDRCVAAGAACSTSDAVCIAGEGCVACGAPGQPCCDGARCADFGCCDPATGRCVAGGGVWGEDFDPACADEHTVCDCGPHLSYHEVGMIHTCTRPGVCRANHAPVALDVSVRNIWRSPCVPVTMTAYDNDDDHVFFRLVGPPRNGFLTTQPSAGRAATGSAPRDPDAFPVWGELNGPEFTGWTTGLPAVAPPDDAPRDCAPRCFLDDSCPANRTCPDCSTDDYRVCPEAWYQQVAICYVPFVSDFTGFDTFQFAVFDIHGAESAPATVSIEVVECPLGDTCWRSA